MSAILTIRYLYMRTISFYSIILGGLLWALSLCAEVNIAVIAPMDGSDETAGTELINGVQIAVGEINKNGGILGEKINLIKIEDRCNDRFAVSTAQMMSLNGSPKDKIAMVVGPYCGNAFSQVASIYASSGIFQIVPTEFNAAHIQLEQGGPVLMSGYQKQQAYDFCRYFLQNYEWMNVAVVYDNANRETALAVKNEFEENNVGAKITLYNFEEAGYDYGVVADRILEDRKQIAYILGTSEHIARMARKLKGKKKKFIIFTNRYQSMPDFESVMGSLSEGCYFLELPSLKDSPDFTETLVRLRLLGIEPKGISVYGYAAVKLWEDIVRAADSLDYQKLSQTLRDESFDSEWRQIMLTNTSGANSVSYSIYEMIDGEYAQVY